MRISYAGGMTVSKDRLYLFFPDAEPTRVAKVVVFGPWDRALPQVAGHRVRMLHAMRCDDGRVVLVPGHIDFDGDGYCREWTFGGGCWQLTPREKKFVVRDFLPVGHPDRRRLRWIRPEYPAGAIGTLKTRPTMIEGRAPALG
jgi:hypothetical protein